MNGKNNGRVLIAEYSAVQGLYYMGYVCINSFAALFLQSRGYSNSAVGLVLALGNVIGFFLAPTLATFIDKGGRVTVYHCLYGILAVEGIAELLLLYETGRSLEVGAVYVLLLACAVAANPMNTALCFDMDKTGKHINYGAARGIGSLGFAVLSLYLGRLCISRSPEIVPVIGGTTVLVQMLLLALILYTRNKRSTGAVTGTFTENKYGLSMPAFIKKNRRFCIMCFGTGLVMFASGILSNFTINIVESVGGDANNMGIYNALTAMVEIPVMMLYSRIAGNIRCSRVIRLSVIGYIIRLYSFAVIKNITGLYLTCITDIFSYALLIPALVDYTSTVIGYEDMAKGQTVSAAMMTLGTILASQLGGIMLDYLSVRQTIYVSIAVCAVGALVCCIAVDTRRD